MRTSLMVGMVLAFLAGCESGNGVTVLYPPADVQPIRIKISRKLSRVRSVGFAAAGKRFVYGGRIDNKGYVKGYVTCVVDIASGQTIRELPGSPIGLHDGMLVVKRDDEVSVYDVDPDDVLKLWRCDSWRGSRWIPGNDIVLPCGKFIQTYLLRNRNLAKSRPPGTQRPWTWAVRDLRNGDVVMRMEHQGRCPSGIIPSPDRSSYVILHHSDQETGRSTLNVSLKDASTGKVRWTRSFPDSRDLNWVAHAGFDALGRTLLIPTMWNKPMPPGHKGKIVVRADYRLIDVASEKTVLSDSGVHYACLTADRKALHVKKEDGTHVLLSIPDGKELGQASVTGASGMAARSLGLDGTSAEATQTVEWFEIQTGKRLGTVRLPASQSWTPMAITDNGRWLLLSDGSGLGRRIIATASGQTVLHFQYKPRKGWNPYPVVIYGDYLVLHTPRAILLYALDSLPTTPATSAPN